MTKDIVEAIMILLVVLANLGVGYAVGYANGWKARREIDYIFHHREHK